MKLLLDIGNTTISWTYCDNDVPDEVSYFVTNLDFLESQFEEAWSVLDAPERILVSSVATRDIRDRLSSWCEARWSMQPQFVTSAASACGVTNAYTVPEKLGSDRWVALIAAVSIYPGKTCCIVDCGTAITFDVVNGDGEHLGGLIVPGLNLMRSSLLERTNIRIDQDDEGNISLLARDTADAVKGGALYAVVASIDRILGDVEDALGCKLIRIITGGDAEKVLPLLRNRCVHEPTLVLQGLLRLAMDTAVPESES